MPGNPVTYLLKPQKTGVLSKKYTEVNMQLQISGRATENKSSPYISIASFINKIKNSKTVKIMTTYKSSLEHLSLYIGPQTKVTMIKDKLP